MSISSTHRTNSTIIHKQRGIGTYKHTHTLKNLIQSNAEAKLPHVNVFRQRGWLYNKGLGTPVHIIVDSKSSINLLSQQMMNSLQFEETRSWPTYHYYSIQFSVLRNASSYSQCDIYAQEFPKYHNLLLTQDQDGMIWCSYQLMYDQKEMMMRTLEQSRAHTWPWWVPCMKTYKEKHGRCKGSH